jgi:glycerate-2-kinase
MFIRNFDQLAISEGRKVVLAMIEAGLTAIQPEQVMSSQFIVYGSQLEISGSRFNLDKFERVFLVGFGKGSAEISRIIVDKMMGNSQIAEKLDKGWVIDVEDSISNLKSQISNVKFSLGTHPLPSEQNVEFTKMVVGELERKLTEKDLVLVVICGGGSAMFTLPNCPIEELVETNKKLLKSGVTISEMNAQRKKLDRVKGGGLAEILSPATVASLIFSDVPGNDLSVIASGPTVIDKTDSSEAKVHNILMLSNLTAIQAMGRTAQELGFQVTVHSDRLQGEAREVGAKLIRLIAEQGKHQIILAGGETTVTVKGNGRGGRNQELVLGALLEMMGKQVVGIDQLERMRLHSGKEMSDETRFAGVTVASFGSDGWDNSSFAGAIADENLKFKIRNLKLDVDEYLKNNDAFSFFEKLGDGIETGRLPCNVSDLMIVLKD